MVKTYPTLEQTFKIFFELFLQEFCYFNRKILHAIRNIYN